jgi:hypothetical protein
MITVTGAAWDLRRKIHLTRRPQQVETKELHRILDELCRTGGLTDRDEALLENLRELHVISLDQARRLWWPGAKSTTAYRRLSRLVGRHLLAGARIPPAGMQSWGLAVGKVYARGPGGRLWLREEVDGRSARHLKRNQVLHDLLTGELYVRLTEAVRRRGENWSLAWAGERDASCFERGADVPLVAPDAQLGVVPPPAIIHQPGVGVKVGGEGAGEGQGEGAAAWRLTARLTLCPVRPACYPD